MSDKIRVLSIDSHPLWCVGVASVINRQPDMRLVAQASSGGEAIDYFRKHQTDVILMDVQLPDINGIEFMMAIRAECPNARFIILTRTHLINASAESSSRQDEAFRESSPRIARSGQPACESSVARQTVFQSSSVDDTVAGVLHLVFCSYDCGGEGKSVRS